jgi:hypothetical protein
LAIEVEQSLGSDEVQHGAVFVEQDGLGETRGWGGGPR